MFTGFKSAIGLNTKLRCLSRGIATASKSTKLGIVGCGNVGNAVANNLLRKGFQVVAAFDPNKDQLEKMPKGITHAKTPREVVDMVDVVITGLPRPPNVKAAAEGPDGILAGLTTDKTWIDHSTTNYEQTLEYSDKAKSQGSHVLEAPITGGLEALKQAQMVVHLGGDIAVASAMNPILEASYSGIFYVGPIGSAMMVKVVSNMLAAVNIVSMGEVLMLAKKAGVDLKTFWNAIRLSAGNSFVWETGSPVVFNETYDPGFTMALLCKDLQLGCDMAKKFEVPMDMNHFALSIYLRTMYQFGGEAGCYAPPKTYEVALGERLGTPGFENWTYENKIQDGSLFVSHKGID
ncbi:2-hydroxy-3-oxopropionate reductase-like [Palaemon carinicauda]|uniref:2-hydroxy-3-oxopropionate reductase-like n=1 Tax=Palaemon carinicauda TaxID=392227 RepID=UPI0035B62E17